MKELLRREGIVSNYGRQVVPSLVGRGLSEMKILHLHQGGLSDIHLHQGVFSEPQR